VSHASLIQLSSIVAVTGVLLLTCGAAGGVLLASRGAQWFGSPRRRVFRYHRLLALIGATMLILHPLPLVLARSTTGVSLASVFVPFLATEKITIVAYGTLALDVLLVVLVTSLLRGRVFRGSAGRRAWRLLHYGAYPAVFLGLYHGLSISRDFGPDAAVNLLDPRKVLLGLAAVVLTFLVARRVFAAWSRKAAGGGRG
jgi:DMSO/TMAO reductase YedYZ heme-binding membrane subunit